MAFWQGDYAVSSAYSRAALELEESERIWTTGRTLNGEAMAAELLAADSSGEHLSNATTPRETVRAGLTTRETEVLRLVASGATNKEIARDLQISVATVERHLANVYTKIGARGRADATAFAITNGLTQSWGR